MGQRIERLIEGEEAKEGEKKHKMEDFCILPSGLLYFFLPHTNLF